jgi:tRNA (guanine-N7-)-methyltransferase
MEPDTDPDAKHHPPVRSFVRREGRITPAQQRALSSLWPRYGFDADAPLTDSMTLFGRHAPLEVEIGCGNGDALLSMAAERVDHDFIGIEVYRPGVGKLLAGIEGAGLENVRICNRDAVEVVRDCLPPESVTRILVLFPDPWPKKRHHKRRLLQPGFVRLLAERLLPGGELLIATDWREYAEFAMEAVSGEPLLRNVCGAGQFAPRPDTRPVTKFERRGQRLGHEVFDIVMRRVA